MWVFCRKGQGFEVPQRFPSLGPSQAVGDPVGFLLLMGSPWGPKGKAVLSSTSKTSPLVCGPGSSSSSFSSSSSYLLQLHDFALRGGSGMEQVPAPALGAASTHPCSFPLAAPFCWQTSPECHQARARDDQGRRTTRLELIQGVL